MIKINNLELQEASCNYSNSMLQLEFDIQDMTLSELEEYFSLNTDAIIEQYENEILLNKWYYKEFQSIGYQKTELGWHIKISLTVTSMSSTDLSEIYTLIQEKEDAILEIASLIDTSDVQSEFLNKKIEEIDAAIQELKSSINQRLAELQTTIYSVNNKYTNLTDRIARIENNFEGE